MRLDKDGNDVTDAPEKWADTDCEIVWTQYPHPSITSGWHTSGPETTWIRTIGGEWIYTDLRPLRKVIDAWKAFGIEWFQLEGADSHLFKGEQCT